MAIEKLKTYALTFLGYIISLLASVKPNGMHVLLLFSLGDHRYNQRNLFWEGRNFSIGIPKQMSPPPFHFGVVHKLCRLKIGNF